MSVKLRMQRRGARHAAHYRIVAADSRSPRDGRYIELLGVYNPRGKEPEDELRLNLVRVEHWLSVGALPSDTVCSMIRRARRQPNEPLEEMEEEIVRVDSTSSEGEKVIEETTVAIAEDPVSEGKDGENPGEAMSDSVAKSNEEAVAETVEEASIESEKSDNQEEDEEKSVS